MNWNHINLESPCERVLHLIDPLTFQTLLLEIECNLPTIDETSVLKQFNEDLQSRVEEARDIMISNLQNITRHAQALRAGG